MVSYKLDTDLVAWYPMTEGSGTTLNDYSDNSNDGTITGADWVKTPYMGNYGLNFNGSTDYAYINDASKLSFTDGSGNDTPFTISVWVKITTLGTHTVFNKYTSTSNQEYNLFTFANGALAFDVYTSSNSNYIRWTTDAGIVSVGSWYHIVVTGSSAEDTTKIKIYVNTDEKSTSTSGAGTYTGFVTGTGYFALGAVNINTTPIIQYTGRAAYLMVFNRALTLEEIKDIYNKTYRS